MGKTSVKVYFESDAADGSKRTYSRTVNYVDEAASNDDLLLFGAAFKALLGKEVTRSEKITVVSL